MKEKAKKKSTTTKSPKKKALKKVNINSPDQYIVGVGASAGGLEALEQFFLSININCQMSFIVTQHLSPDFKSFMPEILQRCTDMTIHTAEEGMPVEPSTLYILPPKKNLIIENGILRLSDIRRTNIPNRPIDIFFQSLAIDQGKKSIAIVFSGTGSDGTIGIRHIHEAGGKVFVQDPESSKFDGMPKSAIATNFVDLIGEPETIAHHLSDYVNGSENSLDSEFIEQEKILSASSLFKIVEERYDVDFSRYKTPTIMRRINKRMDLNRCKTFKEYLNVLENKKTEAAELYYDMLIGVTEFFRDKKAFETLEKKVIPEIFKKKKDSDEIRVWGPGCASGEEAYSIAILLHEFRRIHERSNNIKIFASDIDERILEKASNGIFEPESLKLLSEDLKERYFIKKGDSYSVSPEIRKSIVFARHNVLKDPPFTKIDLITCRNLLIYFNEEAQQDAIGYMHFALTTDGHLFLGPSESLGKYESAFSVLEKRWKIFKKLYKADVPNKGFERPTIFSPIKNTRNSSPFKSIGSRKATLAPQHLNLKLILDKLIHEYIPPSLLVNSHLELFHIFGDAGKYLSNNSGPVENNLKRMMNEQLVTSITLGIQKTKKEKIILKQETILVENGETSNFVIGYEYLKDLNGNHSDLFLITIDELAEKEKKEVTHTFIKNSPEEDRANFDRISILESELQSTKEDLQATIEELETTNEELQSTNEELLASNEELQSTNEELHSVNEELYTVNTEYQNKISELTQLSNDEENFLKSTNIGTLFLSSDLTVRKYTPAIAEAFNLLQQDVGRPITHITHNLENIDLVDIVTRTKENQEYIEMEVFSSNDSAFQLRSIPYKTQYDQFDGVVLTLVDITKSRADTQKINQQEQIIRTVIDEVTDGWWDWDLTGKKNLFYMSPKFKDMLGYKDHDIENTYETWKKLLHKEDVAKAQSAFSEHKHKGVPYNVLLRFYHANGSLVAVKSRGLITKDSRGRSTRMIGTHTDIQYLERSPEPELRA